MNTAAEETGQVTPPHPHSGGIPRSDYGRRVAPLLAPLLVAAAPLLLFAAAFGFAFVCWDDGPNVYENPYFNPAVTAQGISHFWQHAYNDLYTPVTSTVWALLSLGARLPHPVGVFGGNVSTLDATPYHAAGVVAHALGAVFVYFLLRRLLRTVLRRGGEDGGDSAGTVGAALGALLFAVHPLQVESVAWVTGNNNVFSGVLVLAALLLYVRGAMGERPGWLWYGAATVVYGLALLAKPTAVAAPLLAATLEMLVLRRPARRWLPGMALWAAIALGCLLLTRAVSPASAGIHVSVAARPVLTLDAFAFYLYKLFVPLPSGVDYGRTPAYILAHGWVWANVGAVLLLFAALAALAVRRGVGWPLAAFLLFVFGALPMTGLIPFYFEQYSTVADRYLYLSLLGPSLALALLTVRGVSAAWRGFPPACGAYGAAGAIVAIAAVAAAVQLPTWQNSVTLFQHAVAVNPDSPPMWHNLSNALLDRAGPGDVAAAERAENTALHLWPEYPEAHFQLGQVLENEGRRAEAAVQFAEAARLAPSFFDAWFRDAVALAALGRPAEAISAMRRAAALRPGAAEPHYILGVLLANAGRRAEAEREFRSAVQIKPDYAEAHYNLAAVLDRQGKTAEAIPEYETALRLAPNNPAPRAALEAARRRAGTAAPAGG